MMRPYSTRRFLPTPPGISVYWIKEAFGLFYRSEAYGVLALGRHVSPETGKVFKPQRFQTLERLLGENKLFFKKAGKARKRFETNVS
jgi:hypothetical protein